ncbi:hypothetical protein CRM22_001754 [Opisthorchis felineus]|uniref:Uncharacterized protein n=1 Tax=Opisthorchis felineus TaxID=147828 RepID=A0A4V3SGN2_OPIFE|nr:hypothetical protein CRM22_001754 [Opisthorchis felineus]
MVMPCSILFGLYFASLLEDIAEAKLPPRPTVCPQDILERTTRCREAESRNLLQLLPTDPNTLVLGIFLGHLLRICNAAERLTNCNYIFKITGCQLPREWNSREVDEPIKLLAELCQDPQIFETPPV